MKNVVAKPLDALERFIGEWSVEGKHVALPRTPSAHARDVRRRREDDDYRVRGKGCRHARDEA